MTSEDPVSASDGSRRSRAASRCQPIATYVAGKLQLKKRKGEAAEWTASPLRHASPPTWDVGVKRGRTAEQ
jgi:hypothetical protein